MKKLITKSEKRKRRQIRVRARISGTADCPRLNIFKSLKGIFAQIIDDEAKKTLVSASNKKIVKSDTKDYKGKSAEAYLVGKELAVKALEKKISKVVFDRAGYKYHGRVKALAEGAKDGGLKF